jgi:hypothetical protein
LSIDRFSKPSWEPRGFSVSGAVEVEEQPETRAIVVRTAKTLAGSFIRSPVNAASAEKVTSRSVN